MQQDAVIELVLRAKNGDEQAKNILVRVLSMMICIN